MIYIHLFSKFIAFWSKYNITKRTLYLLFHLLNDCIQKRICRKDLYCTAFFFSVMICNNYAALYVSVIENLCAILFIVQNFQMFIIQHFFIPSFWSFTSVE